MKKLTFVFGSVLALTLLVVAGKDLEAKRYTYQYQSPYFYQYQTPYAYQYQYQTPAGMVIPVLTVTPTTVLPGGTLHLALDINDGSTWPTVSFTKGTSETGISFTLFPCFQRCIMDVTKDYIVPTSWAPGTDYYAKVYDHNSNQYIKTNFTVGQ